MLPAVGRGEVDTELSCRASNSNITTTVTSLTLDLKCESRVDRIYFCKLINQLKPGPTPHSYAATRSNQKSVKSPFTATHSLARKMCNTL